MEVSSSSAVLVGKSGSRLMDVVVGGVCVNVEDGRGFVEGGVCVNVEDGIGFEEGEWV